MNSLLYLIYKCDKGGFSLINYALQCYSELNKMKTVSIFSLLAFSFALCSVLCALPFFFPSSYVPFNRENCSIFCPLVKIIW